MAGRIVILNGAPRAGKSTLARAVQSQVPGNWINWGVDAFNATLPPHLVPGIGLRPGGELPDLEPDVIRLYQAYFAAMAAFNHAALDVVADLGMHADYAEPFDPMVELRRALAGLPVLLVGVYCALDVVVARRNADTDGRHVSGPEAPPPVRRWQEQVHLGKQYDLRLDMDRLTPQEGAARIASALARSQPDPSA